LTEEFEAVGSDGVFRRYQLAHNVPLNESNPDVRVDFLDVWEPTGRDQWRRFTFILDPLLGLCRQQAERWMQGGRSRWKIENETFNTLKNQGYHFEHNYGHGHQNLSVVLAMLMMLAFLVDQTQQLCCPQFAAAWKKCISKRALWERMREIFHQFEVTSMQAIYEAVLSTRQPPQWPVLANKTMIAVRPTFAAHLPAFPLALPGATSLKYHQSSPEQSLFRERLPTGRLAPLGSKALRIGPAAGR